MLDNIAEGFFGVIGRGLLYIFVDILLEIVFYFIGYPIVKIITFGKCPKSKNSSFLGVEKNYDGMVGVVGLFATVAGVLVYFCL